MANMAAKGAEKETLGTKSGPILPGGSFKSKYKEIGLKLKFKLNSFKIKLSRFRSRNKLEPELGFEELG